MRAAFDADYALCANPALGQRLEHDRRVRLIVRARSEPPPVRAALIAVQDGLLLCFAGSVERPCPRSSRSLCPSRLVRLRAAPPRSPRCCGSPPPTTKSMTGVALNSGMGPMTCSRGLITGSHICAVLPVRARLHAKYRLEAPILFVAR